MLETPLTAADLEALAARGIAPDEARRQLARLAGPPRHAALVRPCTEGDGIERVPADRVHGLLARAHAAAEAGRLSSFVPASGAASRMFRDLLAWRTRPTRDRAALDAAAAAGDPEARAVATFLDGLPRFAFREALAGALASAGHDLDRLAREGPFDPLLDTLLGTPGLGYAERPKGLIAFHRAPDGPRTALEEQLEEAAALTRDETGTCRVHLTVSPEHRAGFESLAGAVAPHLLERRRARLEVTLSVQTPSTDTLALGEDGTPFRDPSGALLFRPAGHGALIENLDDLEADVLFVKNIDNVQPDGRRAQTLLWANVLFGAALELEEAVHAHLLRLEDAGDAAAPDAAAAFARERLGLGPDSAGAGPGGRRAALHALLARPLRVCGMVPNAGEPGGGPFWVRDRDGAIRPQVVEAAEVDPASADQQAILSRATHFNPVFMVCARRDPHGRRYPLRRFVDDEAVIVTRKSAFGRPLVALERPGLWNGAMGGWITRFVHVPAEVFTPVKTVNDLLRDEHQPPAR
jgi:hypothetical protein